MTLKTLLMTMLLGAPLLTAGCASEVDPGARPCPCSTGWTCCAGQCVQGGPAACAAPETPVQPPAAPADTRAPEAPRLEASVPGSPTNQLQVVLAAVTEPSARVRAYAVPACAGAVVGEAVADSAGGARVQVELAQNALRTFWATATDASGNTSLCTAQGLEVEHDGIAPLAPVLSVLEPLAPTRALDPRVNGSAEPGTQVQLFLDGACQQSAGFSGVTDSAGQFRIWTQVPPNTTLTFFARATDPAGNRSPCTTSGLSYRHDDRAPAAPVLTALLPRAASPVRTPTWQGTAEPDARVEVYPGSCGGEPTATARADAQGMWAVAFEVAANTSTPRWAWAVDAVGNRSPCVLLGSYVHDDQPPPTPSLTGTTPASPTNVTATPLVHGSGAEPHARVFITINPDCLTGPGSVVGEARADASGNFQVQLTTPLSDQLLYVASEDEAGNSSSCSQSSLQYQYDPFPPEAPTDVTLSSPSPVRVLPASLRLMGHIELRASVEVYTDFQCAGASVATAQAGVMVGDLGWFSVSLPLSENMNVGYFVRLTDHVGNTSKCLPLGLGFQHSPVGLAWHPPELQPLGLSSIARDGQGNLFAASVVPEGAGERLEVLRQQDGTWQAPQVVATAAAAGSFGYTDLQANWRGDALLAQHLGAAMSVARYDSATGAWLDVQVLTGSGRPVVGGQGRLAGDGSAVVCWRDAQQDPTTHVETSQVWCSAAAPGAALGEPVALTPPSDAEQFSFQVLATGGGRAIVVLQSTRSSSGTPTVFRTWSQSLTLDGVLGEPVLLSEQSMGTLAGAVASSGLAWLAGARPHPGTPEAAQIWVRRLEPGASTWSELEEAAVTTPWASDVRVLPFGDDAMVAWGGHPGFVSTSDLYSAYYARGRGWGTPTMVQSQTWNGPLVAGASTGEIWLLNVGDYGPAALTEGGSLRRSKAIWLRRFHPNGGWEEPRLLDVEAQSVHLHGIAAGGDGSLSVAWSETSDPDSSPTTVHRLRTLRWVY